jgi:hypothetical protein
MNWSATSRTTREPRDPRQVRLVQALLAFPAAGIIGFAGHAVVKSALSESTTMTSPAPEERSTDENVSPNEPADARDIATDNSNAVRAV